ncbi:MAG: glycosyltransferase family 2 protein [Anaerolineae bacterium]|nr:glycosyltransferase family 2 protein [Anaerolineae bacterium]
MRLIVQIPALNEADHLPRVLADIPRQIAGVDEVGVLVIDDGSTDGTAEVARACGADWVVRQRGNKGLAAAFQAGLDAALRLGADIIVHTDADGQYRGADIPALIAPILAGEADLVVGDRQPHTLAHFSPEKRWLQWVGSWVVRQASGTTVPDAVSGFRAYSREAALRLYVANQFSYTVETLIQARRRRLTVTHVPITVNPDTRPSRLHRGNWNFVKRQASIIVRTYASYEPLKTFFYLALPFVLVGLTLLGRLAWLFLAGHMDRGSNVQSLVVGAMSLILGGLIFLFGILADRVGDNRRLMEEILYRLRAQEVGTGLPEPSQGQPPDLDAIMDGPSHPDF